MPEDEADRWTRWWDDVRGTLVQAAPAGWVDVTSDDDFAREAMPDVPPCIGCMIDGKFMYYRPAVMADPEVLRGLLHRLNARITVYWTPNGKRYHRLDKARITADFEPATAAGALSGKREQ